MKKLIQGFLRFRTKKYPGMSDLYKSLGNKQNPEVLVFACSDSRVMPSLIVSAEPGDLFVHQSVGNLIPKCSSDGKSIGDVSEASAIEYALGVLGIKHILVCGHSNCGAMNALLNGRDKLTDLPNLVEWLAHGDPALEAVNNPTSHSPYSPEFSEVDRLSQANVLTQLEHLKSYPAVIENLKRGNLYLHGAWFHVETAELFYYKERGKIFVKLDQSEAAHLLSR